MEFLVAGHDVVRYTVSRPSRNFRQFCGH